MFLIKYAKIAIVGFLHKELLSKKVPVSNVIQNLIEGKLYKSAYIKKNSSKSPYKKGS